MKMLLSRRYGRALIGILVPTLFLLWWQWQATSHDARSLAFAPLGSVGTAFVELAASGSLLSDIAATLGRSLCGLIIGGGVGVATGIAMAISRPLDRVLGPLLHAIRQVPMIGWLPLFGLWFGTGRGSELVTVCLAGFFPTMLNSYEGVAQVEARYLDVGAVYRFTGFQRFRLILLPAAAPLILTGLTQGLAFAWIASIATEILMGVGSGLGVTMQLAQTQQRLDMILVAIIVTGILGFVINQSLLRIRQRLLRWQAMAS